MNHKNSREYNLLAIGGVLIIAFSAAIVLIFSGVMKNLHPKKDNTVLASDQSSSGEETGPTTEDNETEKVEEESVEEISYQLYIPILEKEMSEQISYEEGHAAVHDVDLDGVNEMIILAAYNSADNKSPYVGYSVYDIENGVVVTKDERELLYYQAGGPNGYFGVSDYEGKTYYHVHSDNGETGFGANRTTTDILIEPSDMSVYLKYENSYYTESERTDTGCRVNDEDADIQTCKDQVMKISNDIICKTGPEGNMNSYTFAELIEILKREK